MTLPELRTVPLYVITPPGAVALVGQLRVTAIAGAVASVQVAVAVLVNVFPLQISRPVAVAVDETEQSVPIGTV